MDSAREFVIGDLLRDGTHLNIWCYYPGCRRQLYLTAEEAVALIGGEKSFVRVNRLLVCTGCGAKAINGHCQAFPCSLDYDARRLREQVARDGERGAGLPSRPAR